MIQHLKMFKSSDILTWCKKNRTSHFILKQKVLNESN